MGIREALAGLASGFGSGVSEGLDQRTNLMNQLATMYMAQVLKQQFAAQDPVVQLQLAEAQKRLNEPTHWEKYEVEQKVERAKEKRTIQQKEKETKEEREYKEKEKLAEEKRKLQAPPDWESFITQYMKEKPSGIQGFFGGKPTVEKGTKEYKKFIEKVAPTIPAEPTKALMGNAAPPNVRTTKDGRQWVEVTPGKYISYEDWLTMQPK